MEMNRIICKSCEKLIGLMLKQQSSRLKGGGGCTAGKHPILFAALNRVVVTKETDKHTGATLIHLFLQA